MFDAIVFTKALVVGPIGLLTIQRTIDRGFRMGLATGLGAAVADATYGTVGALGVTWLIAALTTARVPLALGGAALLLVLAWRTWRAPLAAEAASTSGRGLWAAFGGTVLLTMANPATPDQHRVGPCPGGVRAVAGRHRRTRLVIAACTSGTSRRSPAFPASSRARRGTRWGPSR